MKTFLGICIVFFILCKFSYTQETYYWVGGTGLWSDLSHWQLEDGTTVTSLPNEMTDVVFNENAFSQENDTIYADGLMYCRSMTWENLTDTVFLFGSEDMDLMVYGSFHLDGKLKYYFRGWTIFDAVGSGANATLILNNCWIWGNVRFQGIGATWVLLDDLNIYYSNEHGTIEIIHGTFDTNGQDVVCNQIISQYSNSRVLNISESTIHLHSEFDYSMNLNCENLSLNTNGSEIKLMGEFSIFHTSGGDEINWDEIEVNGTIDSIKNSDNQSSYQKLKLNGNYGVVKGDYFIDSLFVAGNFCQMLPSGSIGNIEITGSNCYLGNGGLNGSIVSYGEDVYIFPGHYQYARLSNQVYFIGNSEFDTLIFQPSNGLLSSVFNFQAGSVTTVYDSLRIRGNQCHNLTLRKFPFDQELAWIKKDNGHDVSCDFLVIQGVGAQSETLEFFAGDNSIFQPDPEPLPGWTPGNATNYLFGFNGISEVPCFGDTLVLDASGFNGDEFTEYYWNGDSIPGDITYEVWESQTVSIFVKYADNCYIADYATIKFDSCESIINKALDPHFVDIFPNPTAGNINIHLNNDLNLYSITLFGAAGKKVYLIPKSKLHVNENTLKINDLNLPAGVYWLRLIFEEGTLSKKIIIQ